ncbi:MAG: cobalt ECF transporter T component CbiQ [Anaerolineae bacterium]
MKATALDPYRDGTSLLHRLDARHKLVLTLATIVAINLTNDASWPILLGYAGALAVLVVLSQVPLMSLLTRTAVVVPFVLLAALGLPFAEGGRTLLRWDLLGVQIQVTDAGLLRFALVLARSWLSILAAVVLAATTSFSAIVSAMRRLGVPAVFAAILALMYRYMYVLVDEAGRLLRARQARSAVIKGRRNGGSLRWRARIAGGMIGTLFLRTYERSERIYQAMLARGYDGEMRVLKSRSVTGVEIWASGAYATLLAALVVIAYV